MTATTTTSTLQRELNEVGIYVDAAAFQLSSGLSTTRRQLVSKLSSKPSADTFCDALTEYLESPANLRAAVQPILAASTLHDKTNNGGEAKQKRRAQKKMSKTAASTASSQGGTQRRLPSFVRLLLGIEDIQPQVYRLVLEKISEFAVEESLQFSQNDDATSSESLDLSRLLLNELRWLDVMVDPEDTMEAVFEVMPILPKELQKEVISALPEICDDQASASLSDRLYVLLQQEPSLACPILDALSNLSVSSSKMKAICMHVTSRLNSYNSRALPVVLKFIVQQGGSCFEPAKLIQSLRDNIEFSSISRSSASHSRAVDVHNEEEEEEDGDGDNYNDDGVRDGLDGKQVASVHRNDDRSNDDDDGNGHCDDRKEKGDESQQQQVFSISAIMNGLIFNDKLAKSWIVLIGKASVPAEISSLDLIILFALIQHHAHKKAATSMILKLVRSERVRPSRFMKLIQAHTRVIRNNFSSVVHVADLLTRRQEAPCNEAACVIYIHLFKALRDPYCRQEVVGSIVSHIGTGNVHEVDTAMNVLQELSATNSHALRRYSILLTAVLDHLHNLHTMHIRRLFRMLTVLNFEPQSPESLTTDETHILLRKMLSQASVGVKATGVVATMTVLRTWLTLLAKENILEDARAVESMLQMLRLVYDSVQPSMAALALFCDEVASIVGAIQPLPEQLYQWMNETLLMDFQRLYLVQISQEPQASIDGITLTKGFGFDLDNAVDIAAAFVPLMFSEGRSDVLQPLGPMFRLLQLVTKATSDGVLQSIDAILSCSIWMPSVGNLDNLQSYPPPVQELMCNSVLSVINWIRELLNGFATQPEVEIRNQAIVRLDHLVALEATLATLFRQKFFQPHVAHAQDEGVAAPLKKVKEAPTPAATVITSTPSTAAAKQPLKSAYSADDPADTRYAPSAVLSPMVSPTKSRSGTQNGHLSSGSSLSGTPRRRAAVEDEKRTEFLDHANFRPYLRELSRDVYSLLICWAEDDALNSDAVADGDGNGTSHGAGNNTSNPSEETGESDAASNSAALRPVHLAFLLQDLVDKVKRVFSTPKLAPWQQNSSAIARSHVGYHLLLGQPPAATAKWLETLTPALCLILENAFSYFTSNGCQPREAGLRESSLAKPFATECHMRCLVDVMTIFHTVLLWASGTRKQQRVLGLLKKIAVRMCVDEGLSLLTASHVCLKYFLNLAKKAPSPASMLLALKLIQALETTTERFVTDDADNDADAGARDEAQASSGDARHSSPSQQATKQRFLRRIRTTLWQQARQFLETQWLDDETRPVDAATLMAVLQIYLGHCPDVTQLDDLIQSVNIHVHQNLSSRHGSKPSSKTGKKKSNKSRKDGSDDADADDADDADDGGGNNEPAHKRAKGKAKARSASNAEAEAEAYHPFGTLAKYTFIVFYRELLRFLVRELARQASLAEAGYDSSLHTINRLTKMFAALVHLTKSKVARTKPVLTLLVKTGKEYVTVFIKRIMPVFARHLEEDTLLVVSTLKDVQKSTRHLQSLCNHGKVAKDVQMTAHVPALKRALETLVLQAKSMVADNHCDEAFSVGVLKHKGLDGEEVASQIAPDADGDDDDDADNDDDVSSSDEDEDAISAADGDRDLFAYDDDDEEADEEADEREDGNKTTRDGRHTSSHEIADDDDDDDDDEHEEGGMDDEDDDDDEDDEE